MQTTTFVLTPERQGELPKGKMYHLQGFLEKDTKFHFLPQQEFIGLLFNLKSNVQYTMGSNHSGTINGGHYNMVYLPEGAADITLAKGRYELFCLEFNPAYLNMTGENFGALTNFLPRINTPQPVLLSDQHFIIAKPALNVIYEIIFCDFEEELKGHFMTSKFVELAIISLEHCRQYSADLSDFEIHKLKEAEKYIRQNLKFRLEAGQLADMVALTRRRFEAGFKQLFGTTVFDFVLEEKMKKSVILLRDTEMTVAEVAASLGYPTPNNFTRIFKKRFGYPPGDVRKKSDG